MNHQRAQQVLAVDVLAFSEAAPGAKYCPPFRAQQMKTLKSFSTLMSIAVLALALVACTGLPIREATNVLESKPVCCTQYTELVFQPLELGKRQKFELTMASQVMNFPEGRSFFASYSLPTGAKQLSIQSINTEFLPKTSYVDPVIVVLATDKSVLARPVIPDLHKSKHVILPGLWEWYFGASIALPQEAAYVVVYANNSSTRVLQTLSDNGTPWPVPPAPIGAMALIAQ